ncbi:hypothetical protein VNI00_010459 [Paramarasmius palmivorus]|uniref:Cytochrome c oxidase subunit 8, mitochondrial n=1 Tax=Paramarasmius palmivorus TaxID=297713 RepID=A0AAW0CJD0_9AGAR
MSLLQVSPRLMLARSNTLPAVKAINRGMVQGTRPSGPGPSHVTATTDHLPFSYGSKKSFLTKLGVFASAAFGLPFAAIYVHWCDLSFSVSIPD